MNVRDMHIEVQQSTQHVGAARTRKWEPEEIDWVLNKMQDRFIMDCLKPKEDGGFELDQAGYGKIRNLVMPNASLTAYVESTTTYKAQLPADYGYLLSNQSLVNYLCGAVVTQATDTLYITRLRQDYSTLTLNGHPKYYYALVATMPDKTITIPTDLPYGNSYDGYLQKPDVLTFLVPWILGKAKTWYWEKYDDLYYPGHYIQVKTTSPTAATLEIDENDETETGVVTKSLVRHTNLGVETDNRLTPSDTIKRLNQNNYYKTSYYSPISELTGGTLRVYRDSSFIVSGVVVTYVRKPQPISISLNSSCEIDPLFHQAICDLAVEYIKGRVENNSGKQIITEDIATRVVI